MHAITSDLNCFWNLFNGNASKHSNFVDVIPCDSAFDLTTCNLTCQAEVELVKCDDTFIQTNYQMKCINPSTSTPRNEKDSAIVTHKCLQTSQKVSILHKCFLFNQLVRVFTFLEKQSFN